MPTSTPSTLTTDQIDDLLYLARVGDTTDLKTATDLLAKNLSTTPTTILAAAVDKDSGNGLLHMAAANGHTATLTDLLSSIHHALSLNLQNASGNTPLHWAALNGHLSAVKLLVGAGADTTVVNKAGKEAVFEAEAGEQGEVVAWLLEEGKRAGGRDGEGGCGGNEGGEGRLEEVVREGDTE